MQTVLSTLAGFALVLALVIPPLAFMKFSFRRWRQAPNPMRGVMFRALTILALVALAFNILIAGNALFQQGGFAIEPSWQLGVAFMVSWVAFWSQRAAGFFGRRRQLAYQ